MTQSEVDVYTQTVARILKIEDVTWGSDKDRYLVRYRGRLYHEDTSAAYDHLAEAMRPQNITP